VNLDLQRSHPSGRTPVASIEDTSFDKKGRKAPNIAIERKNW